MQTNQISTVLANSIQETFEFIKTQAPDYVDQLLKFEFMSAAIKVIGLSLFLFIIAIGFYKIYKMKNNNYCNNITRVVLATFLALPLVVLGLEWSFFVQKLIKIKTAPKVFVVEYLRNNH